MAPQNMANLPPLMAFPSTEIRHKISSEDWKTCIQAWELLTQAHLQLPQEMFEGILSDDSSSMTAFLVSYMTQMGTSQHDANISSASNSKMIQRHVFLILHRTFTTMKRPAAVLIEWTFWGDLSRVFRHSPSLERLLEAGWLKFNIHLDSSLRLYKTGFMKQLDTGKFSSSAQDILTHRLLPLLRACPSAAKSMITGSDLLDTISSAYVRADPSLRSRLVLLVYLGLNSFMLGSKPNNASLVDQLYGLKSSGSSGEILADLVTDTPLVSRLRKHFDASNESTRASQVISDIEKHRKAVGRRPRRSPRKAATDKGKSKATNEYGHHAMDDVHVHRMSLITQIQDLFPDLGDGFVLQLLEEYNDDVEQITAHLLDDSLPSHLQSADHSAALPAFTQQPSHELAPNLAPRATPPTSPIPTRRNVFDDDIASLPLGTENLHIGRREHRASSAAGTNKAAILSALAAFDADDDEHDDTYDIADVGGSVDASHPGGDPDASKDDMRDKNEEALYQAWRSGPEIFERSSATRMSQPRRALKSETGMTDEAIEGWAVMLQREPRRLRRLELKYDTFGGQAQQRDIGRTSWRGGGESEESDASGAESGRGGHGGRGRGGPVRGRGGRGRGRGGNVAGPADDKATEVARQRKEANKGSSANHNRKAQRGKKMARAGFPS